MISKWVLIGILVIGILCTATDAAKTPPTVNYFDNPDFPIGWQANYNNMTWEQVSDAVFSKCMSDWEYINRINFYVNQKITYHYDPAVWTVKAPNLTWSSGIGACGGDLAFLKTAMLNRHSVKADVVWGSIPGVIERHTTVDLLDYGTIIDYRTIPAFIQEGRGLAPGQTIIGDES